jgi:hypothetical protein
VHGLWCRNQPSIGALTALEPRVLGAGHGGPATDPDTPAAVAAYARSVRPDDSGARPSPTALRDSGSAFRTGAGCPR